MHYPTVTIIVPTTADREKENKNILEMICRQDYPNKEVLWDFEEGNVGQKRNRLCAKSTGQVIANFDSDDHYAKDWLSKSVKCLIENKADMVGLRNLYFYDDEKKEGWLYDYPPTAFPWVAGATMVYWRHFWQSNPFPEIQVAEDVAFAYKTRNIWAHDYIEGFVASIHPGNTSPRETWKSNYSRCSEEENEGIRKRFFGASK